MDYFILKIKILFTLSVMIFFIILIYYALPYITPEYCIKYSAIFDLALRSCDKTENIPPFIGFEQRFPNGYLNAISICNNKIYSKKNKIIALNSLAWYYYVHIHEKECINEILKMKNDNDYKIHCENLLKLVNSKY